MADKPQAAPNSGPTHDYSGQTLAGRYRVGKLLGAGGMGSVYVARHIVIGRRLAVKIIDAANLADGHSRERLFREAETAAAIGHPNIIDVVDAGVSSLGHPYLVMEYLEGEDLCHFMLRHGPISLSMACAILEPVLSALHAAHARNIVHRDLKPSNIFLVRREHAPPTIKIIDFGIAKVLDSAERAPITLTGALLGTPAYMSPEQATGSETVDARADLYAIGVILYEMLTGKHPFQSPNYNQLVLSIVSKEPAKPESPLEVLPEKARLLLGKALQKIPAERFQSARELLQALKELSEWNQRAEAATELGTLVEAGMSEASDVAFGTLQSQRPAPDSVDRDHVPTVVEGRGAIRAQTSAPRSRIRKLSVVLASAAIVLGLAVVTFKNRQTDQATAPVVGAPLPASTSPKFVEITINGAPPEATVFYDGLRILGNQFRVPVAKEPVPIRVELDGYHPFVTTVVPMRDTTLGVGLEPVQVVKQVEPKAARTKTGAVDGATPRNGKTPSRSESLQIGKSGRNTLYSERFE